MVNKSKLEELQEERIFPSRRARRLILGLKSGSGGGGGMIGREILVAGRRVGEFGGAEGLDIFDWYW